MSVLDNLNDERIEKIKEKNTYSAKEVLATITEPSNIIIDFTGYKKIIVTLSASSIYGTCAILDADLLESGVLDEIRHTLQAGNEESDYYAHSAFTFAYKQRALYVHTLYSPKGNQSLCIYGVK